MFVCYLRKAPDASCRGLIFIVPFIRPRFAQRIGPDFNGYEVDFDEAMSRGRMYADFERHAHEAACNLFKKEVQ